jgi:glutamate--cysteine ligase
MHLSRANIRWLLHGGGSELVRHGLRGLEKESLRVDDAGRLSMQPHPVSLGAALTHPYLTTDYSEALLEIVTPPVTSNWALLQCLCNLHAYVQRRIAPERLWPASMPCVLDAEQTIPIAQYGPSNLGRFKTVYRHGLGHRYGHAMQAIAGIHFNYSMVPAFWQAWNERSGGTATPAQLRSSAYMALVRNYRRFAWLTIYLFGASPALCKSFLPRGQAGLEEFDRHTWFAPYATSLRMSDLGYRNGDQARLNISANSLDDYVAGLRRALTTVDANFAAIGVKAGGEYRQLNSNVLQIENEYYSSVRPKPNKDDDQRPVVALEQHGIEYVEIRTLDLNPADPVGVSQAQLRFLEAMLIYCMLADSPPILAAEQEEIGARELLVAREGRRLNLQLPRAGRRIPLAEWGRELVDGIAIIAELLDSDAEGYMAAVEAQRHALADPSLTPSARFLEALSSSGQGFFHFVLEQSAAHREYLLDLPVNAEQESAFDALRDASLARAAELAAAVQPSFDDFLAAHARVL